MSNSTGRDADDIDMADVAFYVGSGCLGAIFNTLVLYIAYRYVDTDEKPGQIIVINMSAADFLFCIVYIITRPFVAIAPVSLCYPYYIAIFTVQLCSCMNLLWLNVDKLIFIHMPLHYYTIVTRVKILTLTIATWLCLLAFGSFESLTMSFGNTCVQATVVPIIYFILCMIYVVLIFASFIISGIIYFIALRSTQMEQRARTKLFKRLLFVFSSTMWTFLTCLPYRLSFAIVMQCSTCHTPFLRFAIDLFFRMLVIGTVINPLITMITQRVYRNRLVAILRVFGFFRVADSNSAHFTSISQRNSYPSTARCGEDSRPLNSTTNV